MVEVTHFPECLVRTGDRLKNRKRFHVNWGLSQAPSWEIMKVLWFQPGEGIQAEMPKSS